MEPTEVHEFTEQLKESGEQKMREVSLLISILAVLVAMVTVLGHRTHTEAVLLQTRAADQWNEYQARKIRQGQISVASDLLSLQPNANQAGVEKRLSEYKSHIEKWNGDLREDQAKAQEFEAEVAKAETRAARYDLGEALLQIAVVLTSITLLTRQRVYVGLGLLLGAGGLVVAASALLVH